MAKVRNVTIALALATEAETAPSLKNEPATIVTQRDILLAIALMNVLLMELMPKNSLSPFPFLFAMVSFILGPLSLLS